MIFKFKSTEYGPISERLLSANLSDLCVRKSGVQTGPFGSQLHKEDYVGEGTPIITVEHLGDNRIAHENTPFVSDLDKERLTKYHLQEGDIVFSRVGSVDRRALVRKTEDGWLFSGRCLRVRVDEEKINPIYLSYFFGLESFKSYIRSIAVGATMPSLNTKILSDVPVYYPENLAEQECIAHLLYTLDEKIELNRQTNQTLEQMAQAIFKSWFVDFEPVKAKIAALEAGGCEDDALLVAMQAIAGSALFATDTTDADAQTQLARLQTERPEQYATLRATAELFPSAMQESELGEIPEGWEAGGIGDIATVRGGYAFKGSQFEEHGNPVVKIKNIVGDGTVKLTGTQCVDDAVAETAYRFQLNDGDLVMAMTGATVGKTGLVLTLGEKVLLNQRVAVFQSKYFGSKISWFLFCLFARKDIFDVVVGTAQGSAQPNISSSGIEAVPIVVPAHEVLEKYLSITDGFFKSWLENNRQSENLSSLRDTLLPRLLSGELSVNQDID